MSISVPAEKQHILEGFDRLVAIERPRGGRSTLTLRAWKEYLDHHSGGNPQRTFSLPSTTDPYRDKAAINFLRHQVKLPTRQIAKIVGRSKSYVHRACGSSTMRGAKVKPSTMRVLKERFHGFMEGRYKTAKEAFQLS